LTDIISTTRNRQLPIGPASDPQAYRRDRGKDQLLQDNSYFVLRFLAEDAGKFLDEVLDAILRALVHRGRAK
jgi:very-short-patch-repair endonuclease